LRLRPSKSNYLSNLAKNTTILAFTWSLATEEQFYVFWPPIERWLRNAAIPLLLLFIAVNQCVNFGLIRTFHHVFWRGPEHLPGHLHADLSRCPGRAPAPLALGI
jgi:peptidoglycan/LPS O-acetylase OafA/YrhL